MICFGIVISDKSYTFKKFLLENKKPRQLKTNEGGKRHERTPGGMGGWLRPGYVLF